MNCIILKKKWIMINTMYLRLKEQPETMNIIDFL